MNNVKNTSEILYNLENSNMFVYRANCDHEYSTIIS
jgi:hypothetical protein